MNLGGTLRACVSWLPTMIHTSMDLASLAPRAGVPLKEKERWTFQPINSSEAYIDQYLVQRSTKELQACPEHPVFAIWAA